MNKIESGFDIILCAPSFQIQYYTHLCKKREKVNKINLMHFDVKFYQNKFDIGKKIYIWKNMQRTL